MNGYSTWIALVCFVLLMQIMSVLSLETLQQVALVQCGKQNVIDLSCISYAKAMIRQNQMALRCGRFCQPTDLRHPPGCVVLTGSI